MTILTHPDYPEIILTPSEDGDYYGSVEDPQNCKVIQHFTGWDYECQIELDDEFWSQYDFDYEEPVLYDDNGDKIPF